MSRNISVALADHLAGHTLTLAVCVKITRKDALVLGFTSLNRDLTFDGVTYEAVSSIQPSAIRQEASRGIDNLDIIGLLSSDRITDDDLLAGRYDQADVDMFLVNWSDLTQGRMTLLTGMIGGVTCTDGQYTAEIRSLSQRLTQKIGDLISPTCRVRRLGDEQCKVDLSGFTFSRTVTVVTDPHHIRFGSDTHADGYYDYGEVQFTSGGNIGLSREVKSHTHDGASAAIITLQEAFPFEVEVGDTATMIAGCDRTMAVCQTKFNNAINFHGEDKIPGNDQVLVRGRK